MPQSDDTDGERNYKDTEPSEKESHSEVRVPAVHVQLLQSISSYAATSAWDSGKVCVEEDRGQPSKTTLLLEPDPQLKTVDVQLDNSFVCPDDDGIAVLRLKNPSRVYVWECWTSS